MRLDALAAAIGASLDGPPDRRVVRVAALDGADPSALVGLFERRWRAAGSQTRGGAAITSPELARHLPKTCARLIADDPRAAWGHALRTLHPKPAIAPPPPGVDARAVVDPTARIAPDAAIGPLAFVGAEAQIGAGAVVHPGAHVGARAAIGASSTLMPRAMVLDACVLGEAVWLGPGATIGSVGFGLDASGRLPHVGAVRVGDRATIGAQSCVDRATVGWTVVGPDAHLDNLVQVGHNAQVGAGAVLCGQVGLAGGARIEPGVVIGGQAGVAGHVTVGRGVRLAAQSGVTRSLVAPGDYSGHPAEPNRQRLRRLARLRRMLQR